jgi:hypothetical protein
MRACQHGVVCADRQNIEVKLLDVKKGECIATAPVPLNVSRATLQWLSFSETVRESPVAPIRALARNSLAVPLESKQGILLVRDSVGQVCGLFNSFGWSFVPIFNFAELNDAGAYTELPPLLQQCCLGGLYSRLLISAPT